MNPLTTLERIRKYSPCQEGWTKGLKILGPNLNAPISLGDIVSIVPVPDAIWCVRALDWEYEKTRLIVIKNTILPALERVKSYVEHEKVPKLISSISDWCDGKSIDLKNNLNISGELYIKSKVISEKDVFTAIHCTFCAIEYMHSEVSAVALSNAFNYVFNVYADISDQALSIEHELQKAAILQHFPPVRLAKPINQTQTIAEK